MFKCALCKNNVGPNIHPVRVTTGIRNVEYHNVYTVENEWGDKEKREVDSTGTEITGEALACPQCTGTQPSVVSSLEVRGGRGFQEKLVEPMKVRLVASAIDSLLDQLSYTSKRAKRDIAVAVPLIKQFQRNNKEQ